MIHVAGDMGGVECLIHIMMWSPSLLTYALMSKF